MRNFFSNTIMVILIIVFSANIFIDNKLSYKRGHIDGSRDAMAYLKGYTDSLDKQLRKSRNFYDYRSSELEKITDRVLTFAYQDKGLKINFRSAPAGKFTYEFFVARKVIDSIYNEVYLKYRQADSLKKSNWWNPYYKIDYGR